MSGKGYYGVDRGAATAYFKEVNAGLTKISQQGSTANKKTQGGLINNRIPWIMSTTEWLEKGEGIIWNCNPSEVSWNIRLRQSTSKNAYSTVTHNWPNDNRGTHFDEFVLNLTLQSGNLMPYRRDSGTGLYIPEITQAPKDTYSYNKSTDLYITNKAPALAKANVSADTDTYGADRSSVSPGLVNFYDFLKLVDAPKLTSGPTSKGGGRSNHVIIKYNSNIFPKLTLIGQFDPEGIKFNDSSAEPNQVTSWSATFIVLDSNPRISDNTNVQSNSVMLEHYFSSMGAKRGNI